MVTLPAPCKPSPGPAGQSPGALLPPIPTNTRSWGLLQSDSTVRLTIPSCARQDAISSLRCRRLRRNTRVAANSPSDPKVQNADLAAVQQLSEAYRRITAELSKVIIGQT